MTFDLYEEQKKLVIARLKTLNPEAKIMIGGEGEVSVRELLQHVEKNDEFGRRIVQAQMRMLNVLANG